MESTAIEKILFENKITKKFFRGCFPSDNIPICNEFPCSMVVNTDPKGKPGEHWTALFIRNKDHVLYFDSYGRDPVENMAKYMENFEKVTKNKRGFQSVLSNNCGFYSISFVYFVSLGIGFDKFLKILTNSNDSDLFVKNFVNALIE
jgi:hypothetical protein